MSSAPIGVYSYSSLLLIRFRRLLIACGGPLPLPIACGGGTTPLFLLVLCLTIIGGLELFASTYIYTPGVCLFSLVVVDAHHPFAIKLLKSHTFFQCSCWKAFEVALATR